MDIRGPANPGQIALPLQFAYHRHGICGFSAPHQINDRVVDDFVSGFVVIRPSNFLGDIGNSFLGEHHGPQDGHLSIDVLRWGAIKIFRCH